MLWHRDHTSYCIYYMYSYCIPVFYFLTVLSWAGLQNGVIFPGKCCKSYARHVCINPLIFTNISQKTEMPTIALKSNVVNISCFDLGHWWKKKIYIMWWGSGINGQPRGTDPDLDLNTFKVQECSYPGSWFKAISRLHVPVWCTCSYTCQTWRATKGVSFLQASH